MPAADAPMPRRRFLATTGLALAGAAVPACARGAPDSAPAVADDDIARWMRLAHVPGLAMAEIRGGRLEVRGVGVRRAGEAATVDGDTIFEAASLTKQVFAYLVHRLAMEGAIDLDTPVREYLALPNADDARARTITARMLLAHAGGWRNWRFQPSQPLVSEFDPGSRWSYSGEGYFFLQRVLEARTGQPVARLLRERVFAPLGMTRSAVLYAPSMEASLAAPHSNRGIVGESFHIRLAGRIRGALEKEGKPTAEWTTADAERITPTLEGVANALPNNLLPNVAASLFTTARDYGLFVRHLLVDAAGRDVLERMTRRVVTMNDALGWGPGLGLEQDGARTWFWQWGDNRGFKHILLGNAASRDAWLVLTNGDSGRSVYERVVRARAGRDFAAFLWI